MPGRGATFTAPGIWLTANSCRGRASKTVVRPSRSTRRRSSVEMSAVFGAASGTTASKTDCAEAAVTSSNTAPAATVILFIARPPGRKLPPPASTHNVSPSPALRVVRLARVAPLRSACPGPHPERELAAPGLPLPRRQHADAALGVPDLDD